MINIFEPSLSSEELDSVRRRFESRWVGKGPKVAELESAWAKHIGVDATQVVSINSCTEALFTAIRLLDIGSSDPKGTKYEVIIPTIHFVGAAQAVIAAGAKPVFCEVDSRTLNTTAEYIAEKITNRTRAIILNHYGGVPCGMDKIMELLGYHPGIQLIEDTACAPASTYKGQAVGTFGDIGCWSFDAMKIISTGDGGMMYFPEPELADRARKILYLGTGTQSGLSSDTDRWWEFEIELPGARRSVMNDMAAGIGLEQLKKLDAFVERRRQIYVTYLKELSGLDWLILPPIFFDMAESSYYFFWIQTRRRDELAHYLREQGIYTTFRYWPLHLAYQTGERYHTPSGCRLWRGDGGTPFFHAEKAARETLLLPLHQNLTDDQVDFICKKVKAFGVTHR